MTTFVDDVRPANLAERWINRQLVDGGVREDVIASRARRDGISEAAWRDAVDRLHVREFREPGTNALALTTWVEVMARVPSGGPLAHAAEITSASARQTSEPTAVRTGVPGVVPTTAPSGASTFMTSTKAAPPKQITRTNADLRARIDDVLWRDDAIGRESVALAMIVQPGVAVGAILGTLRAATLDASTHASTLRSRIKALAWHSEAKGREGLLLHLIGDTSISVNDATKILARVRKKPVDESHGGHSRNLCRAAIEVDDH